MSDPLLGGATMPIVGYADRLSVAAGGRIAFMVSTAEESYASEIVGVSHDPDARGRVAATEVAEHAGRMQLISAGSYIRFASRVPLPSEFELSLWIRPTAPDRPDQGLLTWGLDDGLFVGDGQRPELRVGGRRLQSDYELPAYQWANIRAGARGGVAFIDVAPKRRWREPSHVEAEMAGPVDSVGQFLMAAAVGAEGSPQCFFDGKIDRPRVLGSDGAPVAEWDFSQRIASSTIVDSGPNGFDGVAVNHPTRAVTGHNWTGAELDFRRAPDEYGAVAFHRDDLSDAGWDEDFAWDVPASLSSGLYAARVHCSGGEDHVPFVVRPRVGHPTAEVAVLLPTFTYLAYANERHWWDAPVEEMTGKTLAEILNPEDRWSYANNQLSVYDWHLDGTGTCYSSRNRPITNMRPYYEHPLLRAPHLLGADIHLLDWLRLNGIPFDVITDEDVHDDGVALLAPYSVVLSGTHPEYSSVNLLDAIEGYLDGGGQFMYLGGNGFYWVVSLDPAAPHVMEHRRGFWGTRPWQSEPGEVHHATTGEPGGLWRARGRAPQTLFGIGFTAYGFGEARPFERTNEDSAYSWVFEGVADKAFGDYGLFFGGAGGFELDGVDARVGTEPNVVVLATSAGFQTYLPALEDVLSTGAPPVPRADVVLGYYPGGGAIFSTGSIAWCLSFPQDGYDNDVTTITGNVLRHFMARRAPGVIRRSR